MTAAGPEPEKTWYAKPWFLISGAFLALVIILCLVAVFAIPSPDKVTGTPAATSGATPKPTATVAEPANPTESVCGLPAGGQDTPTSAPVTVWKQLGTATVPFAPDTFGPGKVVADDVPTCFAHSPTGALYAAGNVAGLLSAQRVGDVFEYLTAPGAERDKLLATNPTPDSSAVSIQLGGYQFISYTSDIAVIVLGFSASNGAYLSQTMTLQWVDGDWKVLPPAEGQSTATQVNNLQQFVGWSGV
ncbi:hypothetical protein ACL9RL_18370 [Plantibacter sp. Mn2098]|uniref:hypothetical protein n=1 Tax=Plantibacter sp. Mn2098 TaxID=3395266 RepID=UPI003BD849AC